MIQEYIVKCQAKQGKYSQYVYNIKVEADHPEEAILLARMQLKKRGIKPIDKNLWNFYPREK